MEFSILGIASQASPFTALTAICIVEFEQKDADR